MAKHKQAVANVPIFVRDPKTIASLPMNLLWEVTRRHGNYVAMWQLARADTQGVSPEFRKQAQLWLQMIGVSGEPIDPALSFENIDDGSLPLAAYQGALWPLTYRNLVELMATHLSSAERNIAAHLLYVDPRLTTVEELSEVQSIMNSKDLIFFDVEVPGRHVSLNPHSATRAITDEARSIVKGLKAGQVIPPSRRRNDDILKYLRVWDLREGWLNGRYDALAERTFHEIAKVDKIPMSTLVTRYQSAFRLITGHEYTLDCWLKIFGSPKIRASSARKEFARLSFERSNSDHQRQQVCPELRQPALESQYEVDLENLGKHPELEKLAKDICSRIKLGKSDRVICAELELTDHRLIEYFRKRDEGLS